MYFNNTNSDQLLSYLTNEPLANNEVWLLLAGEKASLDIDFIAAELTNADRKFYGGFFPGVLSGNTHSTDGVVVKKLPLIKPGILFNVNESDETLAAYLSDFPKESGSLMLFVDGLSEGIEDFLRRLQQHIPPQAPLIGGGAGSISLQPAPCLFSNDGITQGTALLLPLEMEASLAVKHGWERMAGPVVASKVSNNVIQELNWMPAFTIYQQLLEESANTIVDPKDFFSSAKSFPFGIYREATEDLVRDPIICNEKGELVCVGEVPENSVIYFLRGEKANLLKAAEEVAELLSENQVSNKAQADMLVVDCISRSLFLEDDYGQELETINKVFEGLENWPETEGVLSLGEISSDRKGSLVFFNKTIVAGLLYGSSAEIPS